jgi:hypothetical protein
VATVKKSALVLYSAADMYALVNDIESYPQFLPWCRSTRVASRTEDEVRATIEIVKGGVHKSFTTINRAQKHKMIDIRLLEGPVQAAGRLLALRAAAGRRLQDFPGHGIRILQSSVADRGRAGVQANRQLLGRRILPARNGTVWQTLSRS